MPEHAFLKRQMLLFSDGCFMVAEKQRMKQGGDVPLQETTNYKQHMEVPTLTELAGTVCRCPHTSTHPPALTAAAVAGFLRCHQLHSREKPSKLPLLLLLRLIQFGLPLYSGSEACKSGSSQ